MKSHLINSQTEQNRQRLEDYHRRMHLWVIAKGITHRACELKYFGTDSYSKLRERLINEH